MVHTGFTNELPEKMVSCGHFSENIDITSHIYKKLNLPLKVSETLENRPDWYAIRIRTLSVSLTYEINAQIANSPLTPCGPVWPLNLSIKVAQANCKKGFDLFIL